MPSCRPLTDGGADAGGVGSAGQGVTAAYDPLVDLVKILSPRYFRPARAPHTTRLAQVQERLVHRGRPVPGLTTHQAKGGEWEVVGVRLTDGERAALAGGLSVLDDIHRQLYAACTRAPGRSPRVGQDGGAPAGRRSAPGRVGGCGP